MKSKLSVVGGDLLEETIVEYFQGAGTMLPGLETVIDGLSAGDKREGTVKAKNAFGSPQHQPKRALPRSEFPKDVSLDKGTEFAATAAGGQNVILQVESVDDSFVHVRYLHPLHKKDIAYEIEILKVTDPTPPPLPIEVIAAEDDEDDEA